VWTSPKPPFDCQGFPRCICRHHGDSLSTTFITCQEQKRVRKSAINADFHYTRALRSMGFKFFPEQFRYGADDWFGLAKRIDGDVEGKMRVRQVYLA
jgi:hypothetical protein